MFSVDLESEIIMFSRAFGDQSDDIFSYSGAPYFSSMGAMRFGADLAHVICEPGAGAVIKS